MPDQLHVALGKKIRKQREVSRLTQQELADRVQLSRTSLTNVERGRQRILVDQLYKLAGALNVPPNELLPSKDDLTRISEPKNPEVPKLVQRFVDRVKMDENS